MKKILTVTLLFASGLVSAMSNPASFLWLEDAYDGYSNKKFICATEYGYSQEEADNKAVSAVTNTLKQTVSTQQYASQEMSSSGDRLSTYLLNLKTDSSVHDLSGLEIKDRTCIKNKKEKKYYSRAVLDRAKASEQYQITLDSKTQEIEKLIEDSIRHKGLLEEVKCLLKAYTIANESEYYISMISTLTPEKNLSLSYENKASIESSIRKAMNSITFKVTAGGNAEKAVHASASEAINQQGFSTVTEKAVYSVGVETNFEDLGFDPSNNYYFIRYNVTLKMTENSTGKTLLEFNAKKRVGKLTKSEAESAAIRGAQNAVKEQFGSKLSSLLN